MAAGTTITAGKDIQARRGNAPFWCALIAAAVMLRVGIAAISTGTNDARLFLTFASEIRQFGILGTYGMDGLLNHPPAVVAWIKLAAYLSDEAPHPFGPFQAFTFIFKLPIIAADAMGIWIVWKVWRPKLGAHHAAAIAAAAAWSLGGILTSGYHCNTDPIYAALCLAAVYLMEERKAFFVAGLALGAAINVKIVPVLLIPGLLLSCRSPREARLLLAGLAACVIPFLPVLASNAPSFVHNALAYNSNVNNWGITLLLLANRLWHGTIGVTTPAVETYHDLGRYVVFGLIGIWAVLARILNRWTRYEIAAMTFAIFLIFTPGFGIQYLAMIAPLLFAIRPGLAFVYCTAAGAFAGALYLTHLQPNAFPLQSVLGWFPPRESMLGLIAWIVLMTFLVGTLRRRRSAVADQSATGQPLHASYTSARAA